MKERKKITFDEAEEKGFIVSYVDNMDSIIDELSYLGVSYHNCASSEAKTDLIYSLESDEYEISDVSNYIIIDDEKLKKAQEEVCVLLENRDMFRGKASEIREFLERREYIEISKNLIDKVEKVIEKKKDVYIEDLVDMIQEAIKKELQKYLIEKNLKENFKEDKVVVDDDEIIIKKDDEVYFKGYLDNYDCDYDEQAKLLKDVFEEKNRVKVFDEDDIDDEKDYKKATMRVYYFDGLKDEISGEFEEIIDCDEVEFYYK